MARRRAVYLVVIAGVSSGVADAAPNAAQHELRVKIRLYDGSAAVGALVDIDDCGLSAEILEKPRPSPDQETYPVVQHAGYCLLRTKADESGQVVIPYSGKRRDVIAKITHRGGRGQVVPLRGDARINIRLKRGSTPEVKIACGTRPCDPMPVELTVIAGRIPVYASAVPDQSGIVRFVGAPDGQASIRVVPRRRYGHWVANVDWDKRRRPLSIRFPIDAPTYVVTAKALGIARLTGAISGSARCQFDDEPGVVYLPSAPVHAVIPNGAQFTFSELRGECTLTVGQHAQRFINPSASIVVSGAGRVELQIE